MSKFKVGDTVRRCQAPSWYATIGFQSTVTAHGDRLMFTGTNGEKFPLWEEQWELVDCAAGKLKVGDKVRRVTDFTEAVPLGFEAVLFDDGYGLFYRNAFGHISTFIPQRWELIEPSHQGPVRTVTTTRKVIEPGEYGRVMIEPPQDGRVCVWITSSADTPACRLTPAELRAAAETFTQLANALEPSK